MYEVGRESLRPSKKRHSRCVLQKRHMYTKRDVVKETNVYKKRRTKEVYIYRTWEDNVLVLQKRHHLSAGTHTTALHIYIRPKEPYIPSKEP